MRALSVVLTLAAAGAWAEVHLPLPPVGWVEKPDPQGVDGGVSSRYFEREGVPEVWLRVSKDPAIRYEYDATLAAKLPLRFKPVFGEQPRPRVSSPQLPVIDHSQAASFQLDRGGTLETVFFLPDEGGDVIVDAQTIKSRPVDLQRVLQVVNRATGLRRVTVSAPPQVENKPDLGVPTVVPQRTVAWGPIGAVIGVSLVGLALWLARKRKA